MGGVEHTTNPKELSVADFPEFDVKDDGTIVQRLSKERLGESSWQNEYRFLGRLGTTMGHAMISAFACELAMKAVSLTCKDEASKIHDLIALYNDLPEASQNRIEADYPEIVDVMKEGSQTFDRWRYFEHALSGKGMEAMIRSDRARALGKAARVILDEGLIVGLSGEVELHARENVRVKGERRNYIYTLKAKITGGESPPRS